MTYLPEVLKITAVIIPQAQFILAQKFELTRKISEFLEPTFQSLFEDVSWIWTIRKAHKIKVSAVMEQVHDLSEALPSQASLTYHVEVLQDPCR